MSLLWLAGCSKPPAVFFPAQDMPELAAEAGAARAYDANGDGSGEFFLFANGEGRVDRIGYDTTADQRPDQVIPLDEIPFSHCRHLVLILDGFSYDVVKQYYDEGRLRLFYAPSQVVAPYPTVTDIVLQDVIGGVPARGFEAKYFDRAANRVKGGANDYLAGVNEPYNRVLQYRADLIWDVIGYVFPAAVFRKELNDAKRLFDQGRTTEMIAYVVSSAGVSTSEGAAGQRVCLEHVERLVQQVVWESRGLAKVTLLADHGHSYTPSKLVDFEKYLKGKGWRPGKSLKDARDVVNVRFGLLTFGQFCTLRPAELAADLVDAPGVELVSYPDGSDVVVLAQGGRAIIRRKGARYQYERVEGDPLRLGEILAGLTSDADGFYDANELLTASIDHYFPSPLDRLWRAHFALARNTPDVMVSLANEYYTGMTSFAGSVDVASTHGSLNRTNSVSFIMSTAGALPPVLQSRDIADALKEVTGNDWPMGK